MQMPVLALQLLKKFGPYLGIAILCGLLYIEHLKLQTADAEIATLTSANHQFVLDNKAQNNSIKKAHADFEILQKQAEDLQAKINSESRHVSVQTKHILAHPPNGTCNQLMGWMAQKLGGLR